MRLIAHRGASAHAPENTMAAFRLALEMGARAIEFDVHQTRDGELVVIHDEDLRRVARRRARVRDLSYAELSSFDVGSWFSPRFRSERVPRLRDLFELAGGRVELQLEIKKGSTLYPGIEERVIELVSRRGLGASVVVSSFEHPALRAVRALDPRIRIGYLLGLTALGKAWREIEELGAESLHVSTRQAGRALAERCHERGLKLLVYTVDSAREAARLRRLGVDAVFSNHPELEIDGHA